MVDKTDMPDTESSDVKSLDRSILASLRELQEMGEPDIVLEIGGLFLKYSPDKISAIETAVKTNDAKALQVAAHSLKSSSAYIGALRLSNMSRDLEEMGRSGRLDGAASKVKDLKVEYQLAKSSLEMEMRHS
jgi:two-component system, sensor histidine kinase and response regulator